MKTYAEKLRSKEWLIKRKTIIERDANTCIICKGTDKPLEVHHTYYRAGNEPWEYPDSSLLTLCQECHDSENAKRKVATSCLISAIFRHGFNSNEIDLISSAFREIQCHYDRKLSSKMIARSILREFGVFQERL